MIKKTKKRDKKAWLRIVEAFIAIIIVLSTVLVIMSKNPPQSSASSEDVYNKQKQILDIIIKDDGMRESVLINDTQTINNFITNVISPARDFKIKICNLNDICTEDTPDNKDVYVSEAIVTSTLNEYNPKKIRFFVWMR